MTGDTTHAYVIKAEELAAVNYLPDDHPRPIRVEWINRGTDQRLRPTTTNMLLRTLFQPVQTESVQKLHDSSGLRIVLKSEADREAFAHAFLSAREREKATRDFVITATFSDLVAAEHAIEALADSGVEASAVSMLARASHFSDLGSEWPEGHSTLSVTGAVAGGGVAGAMLGLAVLLVPGVGPVAAAGAIATSAISSVASVSGIIGATGGAIAKMLTDHDVDSVSAEFYDRQIKRGKVLVSVDTRETEKPREECLAILIDNGGSSADFH